MLCFLYNLYISSKKEHSARFNYSILVEIAFKITLHGILTKLLNSWLLIFRLQMDDSKQV